MCQSYALTNLPTEIRDVVSSYLDYRTAHVEPAGTSSDADALAGVFPLRSSLTVLLSLSISTRVVTEYAQLRAMP